MRRLAILSIAALALLGPARQSAAQAAAQPNALTGHWEAQITGDSKIFTITFDLAVKDGVVTGTVGLPTNDRVDKIRDGSVSGTDVKFTALGKFSGKLVGNELRLTRELDYGKKQQLVAHKTAAPNPK